MSETVLPVTTNLDQGVFTITLDRPKVNALDNTTLLALQQAFKEAESNEDVRCILLTGRGKNFCAGQDLHEALQAGKISYREHMERTYNPLVMQIRRLEKPVIAALNGNAAGAGLGLALACDLRIAAENAHLIVGFLAIGLVPDTAVSLMLPTLIGLGRASELAYFNTPLSAQSALDWGLVNQVVSSGELMSEATTWAKKLAQGPVHTMGLTKRLFNQTILPHLEEALQREAELQEVAHYSREHQERLREFIARVK